MLHLPGILSADDLDRIRALLTAAVWVDGRATAGNLSHHVKDNRQADERDSAAAEAASVVLHAVERHPLFVSAALPCRISPPLFNRYAGGQAYGAHVDGAIRPLAAGGAMRTDLSATLFLNDPEDYEGGELQVEAREGRQSVRLPA
ncbi:MAG TPA: 2OG-Fe(II) oxygenase, partial [Caulobacteraceae bacterium]|nr:2OG-Fe(II) oxygenase [Caulobacteraceae bacterium]